jgi:hypothetical protein
MRQHIGSAERDDPKPRAGADQPVGHLGDRAVAAGGHHHRFAAQHCLARQSLGMAGAMRLGKVEPHAIGDQHIQDPPQQVCPPAAGCRVEYDDHPGRRSRKQKRGRTA